MAVTQEDILHPAVGGAEQETVVNKSITAHNPLGGRTGRTQYLIVGMYKLPEVFIDIPCFQVSMQRLSANIPVCVNSNDSQTQVLKRLHLVHMTPDRDSNLDLSVIGSLVYCGSSALYDAALKLVTASLDHGPILRRMKPSSWYSTTVLVVFFYLYVLAVQYIRAAEVLPDQGKVSFQEEAPRRLSPSEQRVLSRPDSPLALTSYGDGGGEESLDGGGESQDSGGESLRSVGVGSASLDRAVDYRPGYNLDPAYNQYYDSSQGTDPSYGLEFKYHDFEQLTKFLRTTSSQYPSLTALYSIGKSVQGRRHFMFTTGQTGLALDSGMRGNVFMVGA
uniref:Uncharacterized protein n=1 Tax=Timema cristinae TaxID=61476 RepID=A0A7R9CR13_TIMCR|nr:unnamed protein product [Timema cristinae]